MNVANRILQSLENFADHLEKGKAVDIVEFNVDEDGRITSDGKVISTNLTHEEADEILDRLYADDKVWRKCYSNPKES